MSLKRNILASYVSQVYVTIIGIVMVPLYLKYMGAEAYGLVGFFTMLQAWFNLLDMGLTPTMARETARFRGGATDALSYRRLVRALQAIFLAIALVGGGALFASAGFIANDWLKVQALPLNEVQLAVQMMALGIALRWMAGVYRGAISGSERLVWLGGYNAVMATMRFVGVLPVLLFVGATPTVFFTYQLLVAVVELTGLIAMSHALLPLIPVGQRLGWSFAIIKPALKFSVAVAFTSITWVLVTQVDKLVLSKLLPLANYGYFTLAVLVASGVLVISGPVSAAIMPRMAKLEAEGNQDGVIRIYRQATQLVAVVASASSVTLAFLAEPLLLAWTGDKNLAHQAAPILIPYAIGNGILAVSTFPYYLQYAKGDLRLQMAVNAIFLVLLIPAIIGVASEYGGVGAGYVWLVMNVLYFVTWVPLVHKRFKPGLNVPWFVQDVLVVYGVAIMAAYVLFAVMPQTESRWWQFGYIAITGLIVISTGATASSVIRMRVKTWLTQQMLKSKGLA
jgi:O-antigen/teichoic acid export membrane protein